MRTPRGLADTRERADMDDATAVAKRCSSCGRIQPAECFYENKRLYLGLHSWCKRCCRARRSKRYAENREADLASQRRWYATSGYREKKRATLIAQRKAWRATHRAHEAEAQRRRQARKKKAAIVGRITPALLAAKFAYWGNRCWMCGGPVETVDHVKPLSKGGSHMLANLRPACASCNRTKCAHWAGPAEVWCWIKTAA